MIVVRIIGLFLIISIIQYLPITISQITSLAMYSDEGVLAISVVVVYVITMLVLLYLIVYFILMKPEKLVKLLKLDTGFEEEEFQLNFSQSTILRISIIVIGGLTLYNEIPEFIGDIFIFWQQKKIKWIEHPNIGNLILSFVLIVISYLLIRYNDNIAKYINKKSKVKEENLDD
jgi:hypothetical protein